MANQVGSAYVSVMPSMDGFAGKTAKLFGDNGAACGSKFSGGFNKGMGGLAAAQSKFGAFGTKMAAVAGAVAGTVQTGITAAMGAIGNSIGSAVSRVDTMAAFPRVLSGLGYSANDASAAVSKMSDHLTGLPTRLDAMTSSVQKIVPTVKDIGKSTDIMLAFNDALLAGGASTQVQEAALEQFTQVLAKGKPELEDWRSIQTAMPGQLDQVAKKMLGASASSQDLYEAMKTGKVSVEDFEQAFIDLDQKGLDGFASFAEQAKAGTAGIATSVANLQNSVVKSVAGVIQAFGTDRIAGAAQTMTVQIKGAGDMAAQAVSNVMGWVDRLGAKLQENGAAQAFGESLAAIGQAAGDLVGFIGGVVSELTGLDGSEESAASAADALKSAMDGAQPIVQAVGDACSFLKDHASDAAPVVAALAGGFAAFKVANGISGGIASVASAAGSLPAPAGAGKGAIDRLADSINRISPANVLAISAAFVALGAGVLLASAGLAIVANSAISLASAGPGAVVVMVGMVAAIALLAAGAAAIGPALTAGAVGMVAFGAAVALVGVGILAATSGISMLVQQLPTAAQYGTSAALAVAALGAGAAVLGVGALVAGAGLLVLAAGALLAGASLVAVSAAAGIGSAAIGLLAGAVGLLGGSLGIVAAGLGTVAAAMGALGASSAAVAGGAAAAAGGLAALSGASAAAAGACAAASGSMSSLAGSARSMASSISSAANSARSGMSGMASSCQAAMSSCGSSFNQFSNSARSAGTSALSAIKSCVSQIQGAVNGMHLQIPRISVGALPHFHMNGKFDPQSGSVPSVSVSWYAKGALFGANSPQLIGVGDNRRYDEAVLPLSPSVLNGIGEGISVEGGDGGAYAVVQWLDRNLPHIIASYTPVMGERDFKRKVRASV